MWTHPLPPPDSGASFSSFGVFVFEIWVLRFRSRVLRFRVLGASFSSFGCFVFEIWVLRASVFVFECFVFETTVYLQIILIDGVVYGCMSCSYCPLLLFWTTGMCGEGSLCTPTSPPPP